LKRAGLAADGNERLQQVRSRERDRDAGQHAARLIGDLAEDLAGLLLGRGERMIELSSFLLRRFQSKLAKRIATSQYHWPLNRV